MIYFIEVDSEGMLLHVAQDPIATVVPIDSRIAYTGPDGQIIKNASGQFLTSEGKVIQSPIEIDEPTFNTLQLDGPLNYTYNLTTHTLAKNPASPTPPASGS